jgi:glycosyl transferase family 25
MKYSVVVINLDSDVERMAHMRGQLERLGLDYQRFSALRGAKLPMPFGGYFESGASLTAGEVGCYASHLAICHLLVTGEIEGPALVLEDDVGLPDHLPLLLNVILRSLPRTWDIVRLSNPTKRFTRPISPLGGDYELVRYVRVPPSTGAYLLNRSGAVKFLEPVARTLPVDQDLCRVWRWDMDTFGVAPAPITPDVLNGSSIDAMVSGGRPSRHQDLKRLQRREALARLRRGVRDFGLTQWLSVEAADVALRMTPRAVRPRLQRWVRARVG